MTVSPWAPAAVLVVGALVTTLGVKGQRVMTLREELQSVVPMELEGRPGRDVEVPAAELAAAGPDAYLMRVFGGDTAQFSLYVGFYGRQARGKSIHSPKNCLPGGGWEPLTNDRVTVATAGGPVEVNRYVIQKGNARALVLYWYQGRGRIEASEYAVKWDLLRDAAVIRRSDEALVRIVIFSGSDQSQATETATRVAAQVMPALERALPAT
jgi:EpsI family protein